MNTQQDWKPPVMVVEDDPLIGELLSLKLKSAGYNPTLVKNGVEALKRVGEIKPRMVLLDLGLPKVDGFQVLESLRRDLRFPRLPIVVLTARQGGEEVRRAIKLGASDYVTKPFDLSALLKRLAVHLPACATA
ncbi:MAG: response regulator [Caulobacteraceae bacterium]|nr:response regulator [Caulobacteraceae bacterium]